MKRLADAKCSEITYAIGEWVFVKLQPYRQHLVSLWWNQKPGMKYFGPFQVLQRIGVVAYKLALPEGAKIHPIFHVSLLKRCHVIPGVVSIPLSFLTSEKGPLIQPTTILQSRHILRIGCSVPQILVQRHGLDPNNTSWEDLSHL